MAVERTLVLVQARRRRARARGRDRRAGSRRRGLTLRAARARRGRRASWPASTTRSTATSRSSASSSTFITSAPTLALVVEGESAIAIVRTTMGATNPANVGARARSAATSRSRCRTTSSTARTRPSRRRGRSRSGSRTMSSSERADAARANRAYWDAHERRVPGAPRRVHRRGRAALGRLADPRGELQILGDVAGKDVLELGCGAAQWSILLARRGAAAGRARQLGAAARARAPAAWPRRASTSR